MEPFYAIYGYRNAEDDRSFLGKKRPSRIKLPKSPDSGTAEVHHGARSQPVQHPGALDEPEGATGPTSTPVQDRTDGSPYRAKTPANSPTALANAELTRLAVSLRRQGVPTADIASAAGVSYRAMARRITNGMKEG